MEQPFKINFAHERAATAIRVRNRSDLSPALGALGLKLPQRALVLIGGAGGVTIADLKQLRSLFVAGIAPLAQKLNACVVDGGTHAGIMQLIGEARAECGGTFPLIGVAAEETIRLPGQLTSRVDAASLDAHHSHFVLVPGANWGDESPWLAQVASVLAGALPSVAVLVNGGAIAWHDVAHNLDAHRPVITIAGTGRTADMLASAVRGQASDERALKLIAAGKILAVELTQPAQFVETVRQILSSP